MAAVQEAHAATLTRTLVYEYDADSGQLNKEVVEPDDSKLCVVTTYELDSYGNRKGATTRNCDGSAGSVPGTNSEAAPPPAADLALFTKRTVGATFSSDGRFATGSSNALSQSESRAFDGRFGLPTSVTSPNSLTTYWAYDDLGRKILEKRSDGNGTHWAYEYCTSAAGPATCPTIAGAVGTYVVTATPVKAPIDLTARTHGGANGAYSKIYYDTLARPIRVQTQGYDGGGAAADIYQDTEYNTLNQISRQSRPYYAGAAAYWTKKDYDLMGRVILETQPDASKTKVTYAGLVTTVTNDKNQDSTETRNAAGQVVTVKDAYGKTLSKTWDPHGNLLTTTDAMGNVVKLEYDNKGRQTNMKDPDLGSWFYDYNALGELVKQKDAKAQITTMTYDLLGRLITKVEPSLTSNWYHDKYKDGSACDKGIGRTCEVVSNNGYVRKHGYDLYGRPVTTTSTIGSNFTAGLSYNADGRVETLTYPGSSLKLKNVYTPLGYLKQVINADTPSSVYWKADAMDAEGHLTQQTTGNLITTVNTIDPKTGRLKATKAGASGSTTYAVQNVDYDYDTLGNLKTSSDTAAGASASYTYDSLNRLKTETRLGTAVAPAQTITWYYNDIGNVTNRSDIGSYAYTVSGPSSVRPHAISSLVGTVNGASSPSYLYDANGNLTRVSTGRTMAWTSFNKVQNIIQANGSLAYLYDAEGERVKETYNQSGVLRTTVYLNPGAGAGLFYEEESSPAGTKKKHYLSAGGTTIGVLTLNTATNAWTTQYWHKDLLGSTVVVTDEVGAVTERLSYEPFGKRRKVDGGTDLLATLKGTTTRRGFTGHEMMEDVGLVNMNGRLYDPAIGRFLSADPIVQAPGNMQSYNRYAYVWNNPLAGTDPSGYQLETTYVYGTRGGGGGSNGFDYSGYLTQLNRDASKNYGRGGYGGSGAGYRPPSGVALVPLKPSSQALGPDGSTATTTSPVLGKGGLLGFINDAMACFSGDCSVLSLPGDARSLSSGAKFGTLLGEYKWDLPTLIPVVGGLYDYSKAASQGDGAGMLLAIGTIGLDLGTAGSTGTAARMELRAAKAFDGLADLAKFRAGLGLKAGEGTLARLEVNGQVFYGINAHGQPVTMGVNAITRTHAEADVFQQALNAGARDGNATLHVDRALCAACGQNGGVRSMARQLGLNEVTVITPQGTKIIRP
ncbi:MAG: hypothetical protein H7225_15435 [Massilia sp.]|nr:hypothetical protein [Aquabacterium sp.]